jgi:hypothetical protein
MTLDALAEGPDIALRVLSTVEELPSDATGALCFGDSGAMSGVVLVENGRVCWAAGFGLKQRLTDLLKEACTPALSDAELETLFAECKQRGQPIGESLVARGRLAPQALRAALLHHTAESLSVAHPWSASHRFVPHRARGYHSAFTFLPVELLAYASAVARGEAAANSALGQLLTLAGTRNSAVFDRPGEVLLACQLPEGPTTGLRELRAAGSWAAESLSEGSERSAALKFAMDRRGGVWLGWRDFGLTFLVHCRDRDDFSQLVRTLMHHGWTSAVHSSVPLPSSDLAAP